MFRGRVSIIEILWVGFVAAMSFSISGLLYYPFLNSDIAVHVYMTESFSLRHDLYFWGQDRLGSLVPLTSNLIYRVTSWSPPIILSIVKWAYLTVGCVGFLYFIPSRPQRFIWVALWFFPAYEMMYHLLPGHPYAEQMTMLGLALISFDKWLNTTQHRWLPLFVVFGTFSVWISDFSLILFGVLGFVYRHRIYSRLHLMLFKEAHRLLLVSGLILCCCIFFLAFAKLTAARDISYTTSMFASPEQLLHSIDLLWFYTLNVLTLTSVSIWNSVMFYSSVFCIIILLLNRKKMGSTPFLGYFFIASTIGFFVILSLRWLAVNDVMLKYFIPVFFLFWLGLLSSNLSALKTPLRLSFLSLLTLISIGSSLSMITVYKKGEEAKISYSDLSNMPPAIIGDYWHSYLFGSTDPEAVIATPHDKSTVRSWKMVERVMDHDTIYLCQTNWSIDDAEIVQFNHRLMRIGDVEEFGPYGFIPYKNLGEISD